MAAAATTAATSRLAVGGGSLAARGAAGRGASWGDAVRRGAAWAVPRRGRARRGGRRGVLQAAGTHLPRLSARACRANCSSSSRCVARFESARSPARPSASAEIVFVCTLGAGSAARGGPAAMAAAATIAWTTLDWQRGEGGAASISGFGPLAARAAPGGRARRDRARRGAERHNTARHGGRRGVRRRTARRRRV